MAKPMRKHGKSRKLAGDKPLAEKRVSLGRHEHACKICAHSQREEIESDFVGWKSPISIAAEYGLADRASVYRHAHAVGLFARRQKNIRAALEKLIEKAGEVEVNAAAIVGAVQAYSKINAEGQWIDRMQGVNMNEIFDRMTLRELEAYAREGILPNWVDPAKAATRTNSQDGG